MSEVGRLSESPDGPDSTSANLLVQPQQFQLGQYTTTPASLDVIEDFKPDANDDGKSCVICGHQSHGYHFGILACRACAAFFRRTVAEKKVYKCRQNCNCPIRKDMRNTCRYCRYRKCCALGMNKNDVQMNRDPIGRRKDFDEVQARIVDCCTKPSACCDEGVLSSSSVSPPGIRLLNGPFTGLPNGGTSSVASTASVDSTPAEAMDFGASQLASSGLLNAPLFSTQFQQSAASLLTPPISAPSVSTLSPLPFALNESLMNSVAASAATANFVAAAVSTAAPTPATVGSPVVFAGLPQFDAAAHVATTTANQLAAANAAAFAAQQLHAQQQVAAMTLIQNAAAAEFAARAEQQKRENERQQQAAAASLFMNAIASTASTAFTPPTPAPIATAPPTAQPSVVATSSAQSPAHPAAASNSPAVALLPYTPPTGPSLLTRMTEGYANYQSSQKSLYTVMYPDNIFAAESYRLVKHSEHVKMERGCLSLMFSMVNDWFQPFDTLDHELKVHVLRAFSATFSQLDQCFKTMQTFPELNDSRFVLHYGQYIDSNKLEYFFQEDKDPSASATVCKEINLRCRLLTNKMRKLAVREVEVAALAGVLLWNEVSAATHFENADKVRDRIYSELHSSILLAYGVAETGARMGSLLSLLCELNGITKQINDSVVIGKIFNPHVIELYDEN